MKSKWYSGKYNVTQNKHLHYLFVRSLHKPETDPVILYLSGGPGFFTIPLSFMGLGPLISDFSEDEKLQFKELERSWCTNASVIFLDNPAGVGYSYGRRIFDTVHNDHSFREDALAFLRQFYGDWAELRRNDLYIAGLSYGGIYAPWLAWGVHTLN